MEIMIESVKEFIKEGLEKRREKVKTLAISKPAQSKQQIRLKELQTIV